MRTAIKYRLMLGLTVTCLLGLLFQSFVLLDLQGRLNSAGLDTDDRAQSLAAEILANLDEPDPENTERELFAWSNQVALDPFATLQQMQADMNSLFGAIAPGTTFFQSGLGRRQAGLANPNIEVLETPAEYKIVISVTPETEIDLKTNLEDNAITLQGTLKHESDQQGDRFSASTLSQSQFLRTIELPLPVDELGMTTTRNDDGIVILVPKRAA